MNRLMIALMLSALEAGLSPAAHAQQPIAIESQSVANAQQPIAIAPQPFSVKPVMEKKVQSLPQGPLYWRIENFASLAEAHAAASPLSLLTESGGKVWLFTLGPPDGSSPGGTKVVDLGPIPQVTAPQYLLRLNEAGGPPGSVTPIHSHPGSEAFFVLSGEQTIRSPQGELRVTPGKPQTGFGADTPMQVSSSGKTDLHAFVLFVVDATRTFSTPAAFP